MTTLATSNGQRVDPPLLTVAVPAYNRVSLLRRCLESVVSQATDQIEVLVSDDSTSDAPGEVARSLLRSASGPSAYSRNHPSRGMAANWNECIRRSSGRYVLVLHDDDFLYPGAISVLTATCGRMDWAVGLFDVRVVDEEDKQVRPLLPHRSRYLPPAVALRRLLSNSAFVRFPGVVVARSAYEAAGLFDTSIGHPADLEMWIRLVGRYGLWRFSGRTAGYRVHPSALTSDMWNSGVVAAIDGMFSQAAESGLLPVAEIERCRARWFHRFILAGALRELRNGRSDRAREVVRLFDLPNLRDLRRPPYWSCFRAGLSLIVSNTGSADTPSLSHSEEAVSLVSAQEGPRLAALEGPLHPPGRYRAEGAMQSRPGARDDRSRRLRTSPSPSAPTCHVAASSAPVPARGDWPAGAPRITVLITSYNRREQTLRCLESLLRTEHHAALRVVLVDDASSDGTADAVSAAYPEVTVVSGSGDLYWAGGMRVALERASDQPFDYLLWLNDDVTLASNAVTQLVKTECRLRPLRGPLMVVGALRNPLTGLTAYSGVCRGGARRTRFSLIPPGETPRRAETMNGNLVLVPRDVVARLGTFDPAYRHGIADYDYGLRAAAAGIEVWVAPTFLGECPRHDTSATNGGGNRGLRATMAVKGIPPSGWLTFTRRHAGPLWPLFWLSPYVKAAVRWPR